MSCTCGGVSNWRAEACNLAVQHRCILVFQLLKTKFVPASEANQSVSALASPDLGLSKVAGGFVGKVRQTTTMHDMAMKLKSSYQSQSKSPRDHGQPVDIPVPVEADSVQVLGSSRAGKGRKASTSFEQPY